MSTIRVATSAPAAPLVQAVVAFLKNYEPFSQVDEALLLESARQMKLAYFAKGETLIEPGSGIPQHCFIVKQGVVEGTRMDANRVDAVLHMTPGEIFPVGALSARRPVSTVYKASTDVFCWLMSEAVFDQLMQHSAVFLDFTKRRMGALLDLSNQQQQTRYASLAAPMQMMATPLATVMRHSPLTAQPTESIRLVFERMQSAKVGSILVVDQTLDTTSSLLKVAGIFTKEDLIGRICLPGVSLDDSIASVMSSPVQTARSDQTIAQAIIQMAHHNIRHLPIVDTAGQLVGIVTERDLFALQRQSLRQISSAIDNANAIDNLVGVSKDLRAWSKNLVAQGVKPAWVTRLISRLNDRITERVLELTAKQLNFSLDTVCWIALGSEGREEQTIATDQDNGLILSSVEQKEAALLFAKQVNLHLDQCGFPLCKGNIMGSNPEWCRTAQEWAEQFKHWTNHTDPQALVNASIFADFRALAGNHELAVQLRAKIAPIATQARFLKIMSDNALRNSPPVAWTGGVLEQWLGSTEAPIDIKVHGSGLFVDAARVLALAYSLNETGTADRLNALIDKKIVLESEGRSWIDAFEFIQGLRLRLQHRHGEGDASLADTISVKLTATAAPIAGKSDHTSNPNLLQPASLSPLDQRILKESFRQARKLQQRLGLDYP
jgi:CBS domain-containing protein